VVPEAQPAVAAAAVTPAVTPTTVAQPVPVPAAVAVPLPVAEATPEQAAAPQAEPKAPSPSEPVDPTPAVTEFLQQWAKAWSSKNFDAYANAYGDGFKTARFANRTAWLNFRRPRVVGRNDISVEIADLKLTPLPSGQFEAVFLQTYESKTLNEKSTKTMVLESTPKGWKILSEQ
jgi:hypothetical protein